MLKTLFSKYKITITVIGFALLIIAYPVIFEHVYSTGRDFGLSLVNALMP